MNTIGLKSCVGPAGGVFIGDEGLNVLQVELKEVERDENEDARDEQLESRFLEKSSVVVAGAL